LAEPDEALSPRILASTECTLLLLLLQVSNDVMLLLATGAAEWIAHVGGSGTDLGGFVDIAPTSIGPYLVRLCLCMHWLTRPA
jgi:hypothetical protein